MNNVYIKFEQLVSDILRYKSIESNHLGGDNSFDIDFLYKGGKFGVEVKAYRTRRVSYNVINAALLKLNHALRKNAYKGGVLAISSNIEPSIRKNLEKEFQVSILDRGILLFLTKDNDDLRKKLESILLELSQSGETDIYEGVFNDDKYELSFFETDNIQNPKVDFGNQLINEIVSLPKGRRKAVQYEQICERALKYIFESDFTNWQNQAKSNDTLHRFDLIAKISSINDFWQILARDFRSRFVIFEFKNYTSKIKQGQIYSTEKYLFSTALRTISIILTRHGIDKNAYKALEGSLREMGKLIICLNEEEVCKMLIMKDNGDDPNTFLSEKIDELLMKLSR